MITMMTQTDRDLLDALIDSYRQAATDAQRLALAVGLLSQVVREHRDPNDAHYNGCDTGPCLWCVCVAALQHRA